jgi:cyclophilin family peptidyl-prolyl cis-trans isomerase
VTRRGCTTLSALVAALVCSCSSEPTVPVDTPREAVTIIAPTVLPSWSGTAWGRGDVDAELARDASMRPERGARVEAWRSFARIGVPDAPAVLLDRLAGDDASAALLSVAGLLEPLPGVPGEAVQPSGTWATLEKDLWLRFAVVDDAPRQAALAFAIARVGGRESQSHWARTIAIADQPERFLVASFDAMSIACARRHPLDPTALVPLASAIDEGVPAIRAAALGALARCAAPSAESFEERDAWTQRLTRAAASDDEEIARLAWRAMAALGEAPSEIPATVLGPEAPPFLVEVEAVRAIAGKAEARTQMVTRLVALAPATITGTRATVVWIALQGLRRSIDAAPDTLAPLVAWSKSIGEAAPASDRHRTELTLVRCELAVLAAIAGGSLADVERCSDGVDALPEYYGDALAIEALVATQREGTAVARADALIDRAKDHRPQIAAAALSALADVEDARVDAILRDALVRADPGVLAAAAGAIAARAVDRERRDPLAIAPLEALLRTADPALAIEARLGAIEALGGLARSAGEDVTERGSEGERPVMATSPDDARAWLERTVVPLASDPNDAIRRAAWSALAGHDELRQQLLATPSPKSTPVEAVATALASYDPVELRRVHTAIGVVEIELDDSSAPIAVANLVALAKSGYYDGLRFHRVVPGFVTQGGDPHGDGYGGPGWVLPCEWSDLRYERGTVGMALAGKDTGGSQFFIAHARQTHLDGRFTVVGRVRAGMDVVDRLLPHDRIDRVEVVAR